MKLFLLILALTFHQFVSAQTGGYKVIDPKEVNNDETVQDLLAFGAHYVIKQGVKDDLPDSDYAVTAINNVYRQVVSGLNYKFDVELSNDEDTVIRAIYVVYVQAWTNTKEVTSFSYHSLDGSDGEETELGEFDFLPEEVYLSDEDDDEGVPGGYTRLDPSDAESDSDLEDLIHYAVETITLQEVLAGKLPDARYNVDTVRSVSKQVVSGINYRVDTDISNDLGWALRATFVIYSQPWTNTREVSSYVYEVTANPDASEDEEFAISEEEDLSGGYSEVDLAELDNNRQLGDALDYGVKAITDQAVEDHQLPASNYEVVEVHSIFQQVVAGMNYRFDVSVRNCAGLVARAVFTVFSQVWTQTLEATPESLDIVEIPEEGLIGGDCPAGESDGGEEEAVIDAEEATIDEGEEDIAGGYSLVDLDEAENDSEIQELLNFGAQHVAQQGIDAGRLPDSKYEVSNVYSVERQVVSGLNYRFDVDLRNCQGLTARATYVVYYQAWTDAREVTEYQFDITAAPNGPVIGNCAVEQADEEVAEEEAPVTSTVEATAAIAVDATSGGWTSVPLEEANSDSALQDALKFGIKQAVEQGIQDQNLPSEEYPENKLLNTEKQVVNGINYRFEVQLTGSAGTIAVVDIEVYSQSRTDTLELTSYSVASLTNEKA